MLFTGGTGDPDGFAGIMGTIAAFGAVVLVGLLKEHLWDPRLRPMLGLGPKGEPDKDDMKANIGGACLGLLVVIAMAASGSMLGGG